MYFSTALVLLPSLVLASPAPKDIQSSTLMARSLESRDEAGGSFVIGGPTVNIDQKTISFNFVDKVPGSNVPGLSATCTIPVPSLQQGNNSTSYNISSLPSNTTACIGTKAQTVLLAALSNGTDFNATFTHTIKFLGNGTTYNRSADLRFSLVNAPLTGSNASGDNLTSVTVTPQQATAASGTPSDEYQSSGLYAHPSSGVHSLSIMSGLSMACVALVFGVFL